VIFDFNGTLSNDEPLLLRLYTEMFAEHLGWQLTPEDYFRRFAGRSDREIIDAAAAEHGTGRGVSTNRLLEERRDRYARLVGERSPVEAATVALVRLLGAHGVPMGVVTGAQRVDVECVLGGSGLGRAFAAVVTEEDVVRGKPDPEGFRLGAARLGVEATSVLAFEDSLFGVRAARAAGMVCIAVEGTVSRTELDGEADGVVARLEPALFEDALSARPAPSRSA